MNRLLERLTKSAKDHPAIAFVLAILPIIAVTFTVSSVIARQFFSGVIADYQRKVLTLQADISDQNNTIDELIRENRRLQDADLAEQMAPVRTNANLKLRKPMSEFDDELKLELRAVYMSLRNVSFDAVIENKKHDIDLHWEQVERVYHGGFDYTFSLLGFTEDTAKISIVRKKLNQPQSTALTTNARRVTTP